MGKGKGTKGQATVELLVVLPAALMLALVVTNALTFFGLCASFDRVSHQALCALAAAPDAGRTLDGVAAQVKEEAKAAVGASNVRVDVRVQGQVLGLTRFTARLEYRPTLFGLPLRERVFGLSLPALVHETDLVVDTYRPGVLF